MLYNILQHSSGRLKPLVIVKKKQDGRLLGNVEKYEMVDVLCGLLTCPKPMPVEEPLW